MQKSDGYILVMTMMMTALSAIVIYIVHRGSTALSVVALFVRKEKARMVIDLAKVH